jgi:hypothetical protein
VIDVVQWRTGAGIVYQSEFWHYEGIRDGLGFDFEMQVEACLDGIRRHPGFGTLVSHSVRRRVVKRFPHIVYYRVHRGWIEIVGFRSALQKPLKRYSR